MLVKKKKDPPIAPDCDFGTVNTTRIFNVRQPGHEGWHFKVLYDTNSVPFDAEHDELDKNHKLFFDCVLPESNDDILLGNEEEPLDPNSSFEALSAVHYVPRIKYSILPRNEIELVTPKEELHISPPNTVIDVIELSDDDEITVVEEVKKTKQWKISDTIVQQRLTRNMEKLSSFLRNMGIENTKTQEIQKNQLDYGSCTSNLLSDLDGYYLAVNSGEYPRKTKFMMIPAGMKQKGISKLIDSPLKKTKAVKKEEKKSKKVKENPKKDSKEKSIKIRKRIRSPSPIFVQYSSDDDDAHIKDGIESILKNGLPSEESKQVPIWKKKSDQDSTNVSSLLAHETFVPRKEAKLRTTNVNDLMRNNESDRKEAERQKEKLARSERERREKEEELKKKNKNEELPRVVAKFKIPRKEGDVPPSDKSPDITEPTKKKIRSDVPVSMSSIDILGNITEAMNAGAKVNETAVSVAKINEDWVLPRTAMFGRSIEPPSCPPRFTISGDVDDDDMDISMGISPQKSPRSTEDKKEKTISPVSSDEGIEIERKARMDDGVSPTTGGSNEALINDRSKNHLNLDETRDLGDLHSDDIHTAIGSPVTGRYLREDLYRLVELDDVKKIRLLDPHLHPEPLITTKVIQDIDKMSGGSDPRLPGPSPGSLSRFKNTRLVINVDGGDKALSGETEEDKSMKKKKAVQWGENATKEFNPNEDIGELELSKKIETEEVIGKKKVGEREYNIVKKTLSDVPPSKSCLKPISIPSVPIDPLYPTSRHGYIRPPMTPPLDELKQLEEEGIYLDIRPSIVPKLPDFVPPPGFEVDSKKKENEEREKREKEEKEKREKEEKEKKEKEEKEKKEKEKEEKEKAKRDKEDREKKEREEEDRRRRYDSSNNSLSPEDGELFSSSINRDGGEYDRRTTNFGAASSFSMVNLQTAPPSMYPSFASASLSLNNVRMQPGGIFERGSEILADRPPMPGYPLIDDVKYQLEMRSKISSILDVHKTMREDPSKEYPDRWNNKIVPPEKNQHGEQDRYVHELTSLEKDWKEDGLQPVWLQSLPYHTQFSFDRDAGLYWPIVQATDRIEEDMPDFESIDVLRILGNNTHFATEKRTLFGLDARLPNGMTHKERFEMAFNGEPAEWKENKETKERFNTRRMYSRVFNRQTEDDAREIHNERWEKETQLLKVHEEFYKKNAPQGVTIETSKMAIERPTGFYDFPEMIQHYKNDDYENVVPTQDNDWYCNNSEYYMPYVERAAYLCHVINHYNERYNDLYNRKSLDRRSTMMDLDMAAFASAQIAFGRMDGWSRVGIPEDEYYKLMKRNRERMILLDSPSFSVEKYMELSEFMESEKPYFHFIIDWLSSIFKSIKPIYEWRLNDPLHLSFREAVMISEKKDDNGRSKDARELFYNAFQARSKSLLPPNAKKSRSSTYN